MCAVEKVYSLYQDKFWFQQLDQHKENTTRCGSSLSCELLVKCLDVSSEVDVIVEVQSEGFGMLEEQLMTATESEVRF